MDEVEGVPHRLPPRVRAGCPTGDRSRQYRMAPQSCSRDPGFLHLRDLDLPSRAGPRRSLEMNQMSGSVDSTIRLLDLADEGRFPLMSHVWRLDNRDESRERRGPARQGDQQLSPFYIVPQSSVQLSCIMDHIESVTVELKGDLMGQPQSIRNLVQKV